MLLILVGFASLLAQVVLLREVGVTFYGGETVYVLGLAIWLLAGAVGAGLQRARPLSLAAAAVVFAVAAPAGLVLARAIRPLIGPVPGVDLGLGRLLVGTVLALAPTGALAGYLFRRAARRRLRRGGAAGRAYAMECLGAAAGGAAASLLPALGMPALLGAMAAAAAVLGVAFAGGRRWRRVALALLVALVMATPLAGRLDRALTRWTHPDLVLTRDTPRGRLTFETDRGRTAVFLDDAFVHASEDPSGEELVHLAATQRDTLRRVLVLGGWLENLAVQVAAYGPDTVVHVEPDRDLVRLGSRLLDGRLPPAAITVADPRRWLPSGQSRFDLVISALPDPVTARANRFWTVTFAAQCADRLEPDGVLALRLRTSENLWTPRQARRVASVYRALRGVFADVQVLPGQATVLLASNRPLERDPAVLVERLRRADPPVRLVSPAWLRWRWTGDRTEEASALLADATVPANTDLQPVCFADTLLWELGRYFPSLGWRDVPGPGRWLISTILVLACVVVLLRRWRGSSGAIVAGYAGMAAMVLTSVLLLHHQTLLGVLYRDLGVLLTLFMLGQAGGAWLGTCLGGRRPSRWRMAGLVVVLSLWSFLVTMGLQLGARFGANLVWLTGTGVVTAMIFASATCRPRADLGRLYAADLTGGCLGALVAALLLIPFSGLPTTTLTMAALAFPAALAVWPLPGRAGGGEPAG
jgi:spermidine synthase